MRTAIALLCALSLPGLARAQAGESVGVNAHLPDDGMLDASAALGVEWIRIDANWDIVHVAPGRFDYAIVDRVVDGANARGLSVFATLAYTPAWVPRVSRARSDSYVGNDEPASSDEWVAFVEAIVAHLRARGVRHFGLWNEANLDGFWESAAGIDAWVDRILIPGAAAVRRACADCSVLGPELANVGEADVALDRVLRRAPAGTFDIVTHHIYQGFGGGFSDSFFNALEHRRNPATRASLREVLDLHDWTGEVWITETGHRATPGDAADEAAQEDFVTRVLDAQLERAWWSNTFFYEIMDCGVDAPECPIDGFGLVRPTRAGGGRTFPADFRRKPAFSAIAARIASRPELVGGGPTRACADGRDGDGDGRVDLADRGCASEHDDDESDDPPRRRLSALRVPRAPAIDGVLDDWSREAWIELSLTEDWVGTAIGVAGPLLGTDFGVRAAARWLDGELFLAIEVFDDRHEPAAPDAWQGDSIQVAVDPLATGGFAYDADDREWTISLARDVVVSGGELRAAAVRGARTTSYELAIDAAALGAPIEEGRAVRASFVVNENDGPLREGFLQLTPGIGLRKAPEAFGEIALSAMEASPPRADAGTPATDGGTSDGGTSTDPSGCGCRASSGRPFLATAVLALLALVTARRRGRP